MKRLITVVIIAVCFPVAVIAGAIGGAIVAGRDWPRMVLDRLARDERERRASPSWN